MYSLPHDYYEPPEAMSEYATVFTRTKRIKSTAKPHPCDICGDLILKGSPALYIVALTQEHGFEHGWTHTYDCVRYE